MRTLWKIKKHPILTDSRYEVRALPHEILYAAHSKGKEQLVGVFSLRGENALVRVQAPDGHYVNLIDRTPVEVYEGKLPCVGKPIIFEAPKPEGSSWFQTED